MRRAARPATIVRDLCRVMRPKMRSGKPSSGLFTVEVEKTHARNRSQTTQHAPNAGGRCCAKGELRPPWPADGRRADGLRAVDALPEAQPGGPALAEPRSFHPLRRARLDAALRAAVPDRL